MIIPLFSLLLWFWILKLSFCFRNSLEKNRIGACGAAKLAEELAKCPEVQFVR